MKLAVIPVLVASLLAGCGSSKEPTLYSLASRPGQQQAGAPRLVELRRPGIAGYLDRSVIVTKVASYKLRMDADERWAEPLGDMIGRVLQQDLSTRLAESNVFVEAGAISAVPDAIVSVDITRFDAADDGRVTLQAQVIVERLGTARKQTARALSFNAVPKNGDTGELVATMSNLVSDLSDALAAMLRDGG